MGVQFTYFFYIFMLLISLIKGAFSKIKVSLIKVV